MAIVTTAHEGVRVGLTINSFNSVAMRPPLVLWSLGKSAHCMSIFRQAEHFAIHILSAEQIALSDRFARYAGDRFEGLDCIEGIGSVPLIHGACARFQCRRTYEYEGGDHLIFVGEVLEFEAVPKQPLVFQHGKYAVAVSPDGAQAAGARAPEASFLTLVGECYRRMNLPFRQMIESIGVSVPSSRVLGFLSEVDDAASDEQIVQALARFPDVDLPLALLELETLGLVLLTNTAGGARGIALTAAGRAKIGPVLDAGAVLEAKARAALGEDKCRRLKEMLRELSEAQL